MHPQASSRNQYEPDNHSFDHLQDSCGRQNIGTLLFGKLDTRILIKDQPFQFSYKYSRNALEAWKVVDLSRKTKGRRPDMGRVSRERLRDVPRHTMTKSLVSA